MLFSDLEDDEPNQNLADSGASKPHALSYQHGSYGLDNPNLQEDISHIDTQNCSVSIEQLKSPSGT